MKNPQKMYMVKRFATFALVLLFCLPCHSIAQGTPSKPTVELLTRSAGKTDWVAVAAPAFLDIKQQASVNCSCNNNPVLFAAVAPLLVESKEYTVALTGGIFPPDKQGKCPSMIPISALLIGMDRTFEGFIEPNSLTPSDKDVLYSGYLFEQRSPQQNQGAAAPEVALLLKNIPVKPSSECSKPVVPTSASKDLDTGSNKSENLKSGDSGSLEVGASSPGNGTSLRSGGANSGSNAHPLTAAAVYNTSPMPAVSLVSPQGTYSKIPEGARVATTVVNAPCDNSRGYLLHYLQDRKCTGANRLIFPFGAFSLIYNSIKTDDSFYGLPGLKHSLHEYITGDLKYFVDSVDRKMELTRSGSTLTPGFLWGDYQFSLSGNSIYREDPASELRYVYTQLAGDSIYRLSDVISTRDQSKLLSLTFESTAPYSLKVIRYRSDISTPELLSATISSSKVVLSGGDVLTTIAVTYPATEKRYQSVNATAFNGLLSSIKNGEVSIEIEGAANRRKRRLPVVVRTTYTDSKRGKTRQSDVYFGYDDEGHTVYEEIQNKSASGTLLQDAKTYSYPKDAVYHYVNSEDRFHLKTKDWYVLLGGVGLKAASTNAYGNDAYRYGPGPHYPLIKEWSARAGAWIFDVTKIDEKEQQIQSRRSVLNRVRNGDVVTSTVKDLSGNLLLKTTQTLKSNGERSSTLKSGLVLTENSNKRDPSVNDGRIIITSIKIAGAVVDSTKTSVSQSKLKIENMIDKSSYTRNRDAQKTTETVNVPGRPTKVKETLTESTETQTDVRVTMSEGGTKGASQHLTISEGKDALDVNSTTKLPGDGSKFWTRIKQSYDSASKKTELTTSIIPVDVSK